MTTSTRTVAGRYRLTDRLGAGAMGTVWRAEDLSLGRDVAVKEVAFPPGVSADEREVLRERTRREARMAAGLSHPNAVTVYDVAEEDGTTYVVMELVPARTLAEVIRTDGPLSPERTAEVGLGLLGALGAAHDRGIVHRDVKPGNVLVRPDGRVVLTDFGISVTTDDPSLTTTGVLVGSPAYMSPERARGRLPGPASDLWSLGATLYSAVEGRPPFDRGEALPTLSAVLTEPPEPYVAAGPLAPVLDGLLEKDPDRRLDAETARTALLEVSRSTSPRVAPRPADPEPAATRTTALPTPVRRRRRRASWVVPVTAVALVGLVVAAVLALSGGSSRQATPAPRPSARPSPGASGPALPVGWVRYTSPAGWSVGHPEGWKIGTFGGQVQLRDPATGRTLRVDSTNFPKADPVADWQHQSKAFAASHQAYAQVAIAKADYRGWNAADWEFTYRDSGADLHALDRGFVVSPHRAYALFWQTHAGDWWAGRAIFDQVAATFSPT